jgi:hypothetical protein
LTEKTEVPGYIMPPIQFIEHKGKRNIRIAVWKRVVLSADFTQTPSNETPIDFTSFQHTTRLQRLV